MEITLTRPQVGFIAGTRAAGGIGIGLLLSDKLTQERRRALGWTLLLVGLTTTIPAVRLLLGRTGQPMLHA